MADELLDKIDERLSEIAAKLHNSELVENDRTTYTFAQNVMMELRYKHVTNTLRVTDKQELRDILGNPVIPEMNKKTIRPWGRPPHDVQFQTDKMTRPEFLVGSRPMNTDKPTAAVNYLPMPVNPASVPWRPKQMPRRPGTVA